MSDWEARGFFGIDWVDSFELRRPVLEEVMGEEGKRWRLSADGKSLDEAIESRLKRTRIMRIRDFVMSEKEFAENETARELAPAA